MADRFGNPGVRVGTGGVDARAAEAGMTREEFLEAFQRGESPEEFMARRRQNFRFRDTVRTRPGEPWHSPDSQPGYVQDVYKPQPKEDGSWDADVSYAIPLNDAEGAYRDPQYNDRVSGKYGFDVGNELATSPIDYGYEMPPRFDFADQGASRSNLSRSLQAAIDSGMPEADTVALIQSLYRRRKRGSGDFGPPG